MTKGAVVDLIVWFSYLQLPIQSIPITTKVVSSNPAHGEVYSIQEEFEDRKGVIRIRTTLYDNIRQWFTTCRWFFSGYFAFFYHPHDIAEILLKVALNTITLTHLR